MSFDSELESFHEYANALPNNVTLLVDTFNTLDGVRHAIEVGKALRNAGHQLAAVRLDSGDLAYLSIEARKLLDAAGFTDTKILASNDLDEHLIESLKHQGAKISTWGVGTRLATAYDQPALGGVYKLSAIRARGEQSWQYKLKLSEQTVKVSTPGVLGARRFFDADNHFVADAIYDVSRADELARDGVTIVDPADMTKRKTIPAGTHSEDLLVPVFRQGEQVYHAPRIDEARRRTSEQLAHLHPTIKRFENPHVYPVGLEKGLHELKTELILKARGNR
jgi:nicotinate phosphoribosyltransferase